MRYTPLTLAALAFAAAPLALAPETKADTLLEFNFEAPNVVGQVHDISASLDSGVASASFDTGNNGIENSPGGGSTGLWSTTRFFAGFGNRYPFATVAVAQATEIDSISFLYTGNHNPGYPTFPVYDVDLQWRVADSSLDPNADGPWMTLGTFTHAGSGSATMAGPGVLGPGTYQFRWIGYNFSYGDDSNTEYFALDNVKFDGTVVPEPTSLALLGVGGLAAVVRRRRRAPLA